MKNKHYYGNLIRMLLKRRITVLVPSGFLHFLCCQPERKFHNADTKLSAAVSSSVIHRCQAMTSGVSLSQTICTMRNDQPFQYTSERLSFSFWYPLTRASIQDEESAIREQSDIEKQMPWVSACMCVACLMPPPSPNQFRSWPWARQTLHGSTRMTYGQKTVALDFSCKCISIYSTRLFSCKHRNEDFSFLSHSDQTTSDNCTLSEKWHKPQHYFHWKPLLNF